MSLEERVERLERLVTQLEEIVAALWNRPDLLEELGREVGKAGGEK